MSLLSITADGSTVVSGGQSGAPAVWQSGEESFCVWDLRAGGLNRQFQGSVEKPDAVAVAAEADVAFSVAGDTLVAVDTTTGKPLCSLTLDHQITTIAVTPMGARLVVGDQSGGVHFLSLT